MRRGGLRIVTLLTALGLVLSSAGCSASDSRFAVDVSEHWVSVRGAAPAPREVQLDGVRVPVVQTSGGEWTASEPEAAGSHVVVVDTGTRVVRTHATVTASPTDAVKSVYGKSVIRRVRDPQPIDPSRPFMDVMDIPATVARLRELGVTEYQYLIYNWRPKIYDGTEELIRSYQRWAQLPAFLTAAADAGIRVKVYMVPPPESADTPYLPFRWDYARWFLEVAKLSRQHANLVGIVMDDMETWQHPGRADRPVVTPALLGTWLASARQVAPHLTFDALFYAPNTSSGAGAVVQQWRGVIDGVVLAYRGPDETSGGRADTFRWQAASTVVQHAVAATNCALPQLPCFLVDATHPAAGSSGSGAGGTGGTGVGAGGAVMTTRVRVGASRLVSVWVSDAVVRGAAASRARLSVTIDGRAAGAAVLVAGRARYDFRTPAAAGSTVTVEVRLGVRAPGFWLVNAPFSLETGAPAAPVVAHGTGAVGVTRVDPIPVSGMVYCFPLFAERGKLQAASPSYVGHVVDAFTEQWRAGQLAGVVAYDPDIDGRSSGRLYGGDPATFQVLREKFAAMR